MRDLAASKAKCSREEIVRRSVASLMLGAFFAVWGYASTLLPQWVGWPLVAYGAAALCACLMQCVMAKRCGMSREEEGGAIVGGSLVCRRGWGWCLFVAILLVGVIGLWQGGACDLTFVEALTIVTGACVEEWVFRHVMWRWLRPCGFMVTMLITSGAFALVHVPSRLELLDWSFALGLRSLAISGGLGCVAGGLREVFGLPVCMAAHVVWNLVMF